MRRLFAATSLCLLLFAGPAAGGGELGLDGDPAAGAEMATRLCSGCHAIAGGGPSPVPDAPLFATFTERWPVEYLAEALAEGIVVGHGSVRMPEFRFEPHEIENLIAYLSSLAQH